MVKVTQEPSDKVQSGGDSLYVSFSYDASTVAKIKSLPKRFYHADTKEWEIPLSSYEELVNMFNVAELYIDESVDVDAIMNMPEHEEVELIKAEVFKHELSLIPYEDIRNFTRAVIEILPDYFFTTAASSSGKYHPAYALGDGGLVRHTKAAMRIASELFRCESVFNFSTRQCSCIMSALNLHDGVKHGLEGATGTVAEHPIAMVSFLLENRDKLPAIPDVDFDLIIECIASHMGQWNKSYLGEEIMPVPESKLAKFTHLCDYLASRKCLEFNFNVQG